MSRGRKGKKDSFVRVAVADRIERGRRVAGAGAEVWAARSGRGEERERGSKSIRAAAHADIVGLPEERDFIDWIPIRVVEPDGFPGDVELEIGMDVGPFAVLRDVIIRPNQQKPAWRNGLPCWDGELRFEREVVGEVIAGQIGGGAPGVIQLDPIVEVSVGGVDEGERVRGHPFIDENLDRREAAVVRRGRSRDGEELTMDRLTVRERTVALVRRHQIVSEIVHDARRAIGELHQRHQSRVQVAPEAGVQFAQDRLRRLTIDPNSQELAGVDGGAGGERPLRQVGGSVGEIIIREHDRTAARVQ